VHIIQHHVLLINHVGSGHRFVAGPVLTDVVEHLRHGPVLAHGNVVRHHQPANAVVQRAQQLQRHAALIGQEASGPAF